MKKTITKQTHRPIIKNKDGKINHCLNCIYFDRENYRCPEEGRYKLELRMSFEHEGESYLLSDCDSCILRETLQPFQLF